MPGGDYATLIASIRNVLFAFGDDARVYPGHGPSTTIGHERRTNPFLADGGPQIQFNMIFPRARTYRVWVQFQRKGVVNTAVFTVPVSELK